MSLLRDARENDDWGGPVAVIPVDDVCRWDHGHGPCNKPLRNVVLLMHRDKKGAHAIALCEHHTACMQASVRMWREQN